MSARKTTPKNGQIAKRERASIDHYCDRIRGFELLDRESETALALRVQDGDELAREEMITANLRFVVKIANEYVNYGLPLEDLIAEGNIGLMVAVERFDPNRGAKFSTYAVFWIRQKIRNALGNQSRVIRLPHHVTDKARKLAHDTRTLGEELGRDPDDHELASHQGVDVTRIKQLRRATQPVQSLDCPLSADDPNAETVATVVPDTNAEDPLEVAELRELKMKLRDLLEDLDTRHQEVLVWRYGLDGQAPKTLGEIGEIYGLTRERIRQIQLEATEKLSLAFQQLGRVRASAFERLISFPQPSSPNAQHEVLSA